jgi:hypothetical protein
MWRRDGNGWSRSNAIRRSLCLQLRPRLDLLLCETHNINLLLPRLISQLKPCAPPIFGQHPQPGLPTKDFE